MGLLLVLLVVALPIVELYVFVQVVGELGFILTLGLLILVSVVGVSLVKSAGLGVLRRMQRAVAGRQPPTREVIDAFVLVVAGGLLLLPGFVTDVVGIVLLLPPVRAALRAVIRRRVERGVRSGRIWVGRVQSGPVVDVSGRVESTDHDPFGDEWPRRGLDPPKR